MIAESRIADNIVTGTLSGRTITLRELGAVWIRNGISYPLGRVFVIQLPDGNHPTGITGTRSFEGARGTLALEDIPLF